VTGLVAVGIDVTGQEKIRRDEEALETRKHQFVSNVGHELRTPLSLIKGYAALMVGGDGDFSDLTDLNPQQQEIMTLMLRRAEELGHLVDDLLTFQELADPEAHVYIMLREVDLVELGRELETAFRPLAMEKGLDLNCICPSEPVRVRGSEKMIGRAWTNLLMNALKFTDAGQVDVTVKKTGNQAIVEVSDTGIGVDPEDHERIFDRFHQADGTPARRHGGSGIGLAVVKSVMEAHGGWVEMESALGAGATSRMHFKLASRELGELGVPTDVL